MAAYLEFILEKTVVNSVPIFLAAIVTAFIVGPFLKKVGASKYIRIIIYSVVGVAAGIWSYSAFDIPDRNIEVAEAFMLSIGMLVLTLIVISPVVLYKNRALNP